MPRSEKNKKTLSDIRKNLQDLKRSYEDIAGKKRHAHSSLSYDNVYIIYWSLCDTSISCFYIWV